MDHDLEVKEHCSASWDEMPGTEARRHCAHCEKWVLSLSEMDANSAAELLDRSPAPKESLCVRVRYDSEGYIQFAESADKTAPPPRRIRLRVAPAVLSAGLIAACGASTDGSLSHPDGSVAPDAAVQVLTAREIPTQRNRTPTVPVIGRSSGGPRVPRIDAVQREVFSPQPPALASHRPQNAVAPQSGATPVRAGATKRAQSGNPGDGSANPTPQTAKPSAAAPHHEFMGELAI